MNMEMTTILSVDDDSLYTDTYRQILELKGFHVVTANDPAAGFAAAKEHHPALVTLDVMMPESGGFRDGFDLLEKLRNDQEFATTPIIMISALGSDDDVQHGMDLGATRYMAKHETVPDKLIAAINELLAAKNSDPQEPAKS